LAGKGSKDPTMYGARSGFDLNAQIEFMNNTIKIKREDPSKLRDQLILNSWTGAILALCSIMCVIFSLLKLLPAIYSSGCHTKHTWSMSKYPGASFALIEALISVAFLALLAIAAVLTFVIDYVPRFFLRTLPRSFKYFKRRIANSWDPKNAWKPNCNTVDYYGLDSEQNS